MPSVSSLKLLRELAQQKTDSSARKLGRLNAQLADAEKKLDMLLQYRQSYQSHFQQASGKGMNSTAWHNFVVFMKKLDAAITEQQQVILHTRNLRNTGNDEFLECQRQLQAYDLLWQRQLAALNQQQLKLEQKLQDEFSVQAFHRKLSSPEID